MAARLAAVALLWIACDRPVAPPDRIPPPEGGKPESPGSDFHPAGYRLVFAEEFEGNALDRGQWCTRYIYAGGPAVQTPDPACTPDGKGTLDFLNDEAQRYRDVDVKGKPLHEVGGGRLTLVATKSPELDHYESAMIRSKRLFKPEPTKSLYLTARVRLPSIRGTWPAFWLNSDRDAQGKLAWPPEIDIFEAPVNDREDRVEMLKVGAATRGRPRNMYFMHADFSAKWRTYHAQRSLRDRWVESGLEWTNEGVCYFLDGIKLMCEEYRWVHVDGRQAPAAHILLNLAIGGEWAGRHGIDDARFPARFSIDHLRVYERP